MSTNRLEAFSDGVIAVAITLLVLNIAVPAPEGLGRHTLAHALVAQWQVYTAYVVSFLTIGIIWINHHVMISRLREADHTILILNLFLLLTIGLLPFSTNLLATYLKRGSGENLAAGVYSGSLLLMSIAFATLNWHILMRKAHRMRTELPLAERRRILARSITGLPPYVIATGLAPLSPYVPLAICGALALFYATPIATGMGRAAAQDTA